MGSADCTIYTPDTRTLFYSFVSSGDNSVFAHFAACIAIITIQLSSSTRYPSWLQLRSPIQVLTGLSAANFSDLTGTGYKSAMRHHAMC